MIRFQAPALLICIIMGSYGCLSANDRDGGTAGEFAKAFGPVSVYGELICQLPLLGGKTDPVLGCPIQISHGLATDAFGAPYSHWRMDCVLAYAFNSDGVVHIKLPGAAPCEVPAKNISDKFLELSGAHILLRSYAHGYEIIARKRIYRFSEDSLSEIVCPGRGNYSVTADGSLIVAIKSESDGSTYMSLDRDSNGRIESIRIRDSEVVHLTWSVDGELLSAASTRGPVFAFHNEHGVTQAVLIGQEVALTIAWGVHEQSEVAQARWPFPIYVSRLNNREYRFAWEDSDNCSALVYDRLSGQSASWSYCPSTRQITRKSGFSLE